MRDIFPVKYYKDEGVVEHKIEIDEDDELEIVNNRPMNIWLHAKCRKSLDPDLPEDEQTEAAEVLISGEYDGNLTAGF